MLATQYCGMKEKAPKGKTHATEASVCKKKKQLRLYAKYRLGENNNSPFMKYPINLSNNSLKPYCGAKKPPKGKRYGTAEECKKQFRLFGLVGAGPRSPNTKNLVKKNNSVNNKKLEAAKIIKRALKLKKQKRNLAKAKKFWNAMKLTNTTAFRKSTLIKLLKDTKDLHGPMIYRGKDNTNLGGPDSKTILSKATTASGSTVFAMKLDKYNRVLATKLTPSRMNKKTDSKLDEWKLDMFLNDTKVALGELEIYRIVNKLVDKKVSPFFTRYIPELSGLEKRKSISPEIKKDIKFSTGHDAVTVLTTESYGDGKVRLLSSINKKGFDLNTFAFQLAYSLVCMNRINLKHNDLRNGNILMKENTGYNTTLKKSYRTFLYTGKGHNPEKGEAPIEFRVPYSKWDLRLFDWDRGTKGSAYNSTNYSEGDLKNMIDLFSHPNKKQLENLNENFMMYDIHPNPSTDYIKAMVELTDDSDFRDEYGDIIYSLHKNMAVDIINWFDTAKKQIDVKAWNDYYILMIPENKREGYIKKDKQVTIQVPNKYKYLSPESTLIDPKGDIYRQFANPKTRIVQDNQGWVNIETYNMNNLFK